MKFSVKNQRIYRLDTEKPIANSVHVETAAITFDEPWEQLQKVVIFRNADTAVEQPWQEEMVIPHQCLRAGELYLSVVGYGEDGKVRLTTRKMQTPVRIYASGDLEAGEDESYTPTMKEQIVVLIQDGQMAAERLQEAEESVSASRQAAQLAKEQAAEASDAAQTAATAAAAAQEEALAAKEAAEQTQIALQQTVEQMVEQQVENSAYLLQGGTSIPEHADLNTYTALGNYYMAYSSGAATLSNVPTGDAFILKVENNTGCPENVNYRRQTLCVFNKPYSYSRYTENGGTVWSCWIRSASMDDVSLATLGITATAEELNYMDGVTGCVQEQLDNLTFVEVGAAPANLIAKCYDIGSAQQLTDALVDATTDVGDFGSKFFMFRVSYQNLALDPGTWIVQVYTDANSQYGGAKAWEYGVSGALKHKECALYEGKWKTWIDTLKNSDLSYPNAGAHNSVYRGKNLGTTVTDKQYATIKSGVFEDLYIGDYWIIGGISYRIAAFDYYYDTGDVSCKKHHVTLVPDSTLYKYAMNNSNNTDGAYIGSRMRAEGLNWAKSTVDNAFGSDHVLQYRQLLKCATTNGYESSADWYDSTVELMNERNCYGCEVYANTQSGNNVPEKRTIDKTQFPLFSFRPDLIKSNRWFWLRDVASSTSFANVDSHGTSAHGAASNTDGSVRPAFSIYQA